MRGFRGWLVCILAALLLVACATAPITRIEEYRDAYESWPVEIRQSVLDGRVTPGMTADMVYLAWGAPARIELAPMLKEEIWHYEEEDYVGHIRRYGVVVFRLGRVTHAEARR